MEKKSYTRHWLLFAAALCYAAGSIGTFMNCTGIIFPSVIEEFGFRSGDLGIYYTIRFLTQAVVVGFLSKFTVKNPKAAITFMGLSGMVSFVAMTFYSHLWQWYISAVFAGISLSCTFVVIPIVINNWFKKLNGLLIGIAMSASGRAGAVLSPIISSIVTARGWRTARIVLGVTGAVLVVIPCLLWWRTTPEELGLAPFGRDEVTRGLETGTVAKKETPEPPGYMFPLITGSLVLSILTSQFVNQIPMFASSLGYALTIGATMSSFCMVGNLMGKIVFGALSDRIGVFKTVFSILAAAAVSFLTLRFMQGFVPALCVGCLLFGVSFSLGTTAPSLVYLEVYGEDRYRNMLSRHQAVNNVVTAFLSSAIPYIYDFTGSFSPVFIIALCRNVMATLGFIKVKKYKDETVKAAE